MSTFSGFNKIESIETYDCISGSDQKLSKLKLICAIAIWWWLEKNAPMLPLGFCLSRSTGTWRARAPTSELFEVAHITLIRSFHSDLVQGLVEVAGTSRAQW